MLGGPLGAVSFFFFFFFSSSEEESFFFFFFFSSSEEESDVEDGGYCLGREVVEWEVTMLGWDITVAFG